MIIISPYSKKLMNGRENPKNYPHWKEVIDQINEPIIQVGIDGETQLVDDFRKNLPLSELKQLLQQCRTWISCDSFFQHLGYIEKKPGIVLWSVSDPLIFGHPENVNLIKSRDYLAKDQFLWWEDQEYKRDAFVDPDEVVKALELF
jgi:ADP-heptose:LPS heptosyltransferase